ncbi:cytochrome C biogenesis protein [Halobacteriales archaeon SW_7_68_16]|nr:MAG: cytochrome C biogenesis protein [Halobacteriales archaeon SW_7_68_16]
MISLARLVENFALGVATPLTAACVLPLYPGFVAYLANRGEGRSPAVLGGAIVAGAITFMFLVGIVFSYVLQSSLTGVVSTVSPVAFAVLAVVGVGLALDADVFYRLPTIRGPESGYPVAEAFGYGFAFGALVIPCNPGTIAVFLSRAFLVSAPAANLAYFFTFGLGIGAPLFALALASEADGRRLATWIARRRSLVNRVTGVAMVVVAVYYLVVVFDALGIGSAVGV